MRLVLNINNGLQGVDGTCTDDWAMGCGLARKVSEEE